MMRERSWSRRMPRFSSSTPLGGEADAISPSDLAEVPLITQTTRSQCVETELRSQGIVPNVVARTDRERTVAALVGAGVGAAVLPRSVVEEDPALTVRALPAELALASRIVAVFWRDRASLAPELEPVIEAAVDAVAACGLGIADHRDAEVSFVRWARAS